MMRSVFLTLPETGFPVLGPGISFAPRGAQTERKHLALIVLCKATCTKEEQWIHGTHSR
jgi:hypothetical protein